jgi:hypothetical protein
MRRIGTWRTALLTLAIGTVIGCSRSDEATPTSVDQIVFATYAEWPGALANTARMAESVRTFGGRFSQADIWLYVPEPIRERLLTDSSTVSQLNEWDVDIRTSQIPEAARWFFYGGKPYAAAQAEADAAGLKTIVIWLDDDTIVLDAPEEFDLPPSRSLAYCPIMHNRSGSLYGQPPDDFWSRIYEMQDLSDDMLFEMTTPADQQKIRAYFHCGEQAVRPEKGVFTRWAQDFDKLVKDSMILALCRHEGRYRVFLHQAALTGAVLHLLSRDEMKELSKRYNYPILFDQHYGAVEPYNSLENVVTARWVVSVDSIGADWPDQLTGPPEKIEWLAERLD